MISKTSVALVEGSSNTRKALQAIINRQPDLGCVAACSTGEEALKVLPKVQPALVLMDIQLPGMSGIDCLRHLRKLLPDALVVMVTVYDDPVRIVSALRAGANGYLLKSSTPDEIIAAIREVRRGGGVMSGGVAMKVIKYINEQESRIHELNSLTQRESQIMKHISNGMRNKEIADDLGVSIDGVRWHLRNIFIKLHVENRTEAAMKFRGHNS